MVVNKIVNHACTFDNHTSYQYWLVKKQPLAMENLFEVEAVVETTKSLRCCQGEQLQCSKKQTISLFNT